LADHGDRDVRHEVAAGSSFQTEAKGLPTREALSHSDRRPARQRAHRWLAPAAIVLLALGLRVAVVVPDGGYRPANDAFEYDYMARSIAAGDGYPRSGYLLYGGPTAIRGPGYPYLLGAMYAASGDSRLAGRLAGAALGALTVLLVYLIARRIWGRRIGLLAATLTSVFPPLVLLSRELFSESLFIPLELAAILCLLNFRRSGGALRWAAAGGALCGLAALTRNNALALLIVAPLAVWTLRPRLSVRALAAPAALLACAALVVAPWSLRNTAQFGRFVPLTTGPGLTAAGVYNQTSHDEGGTHGAWRDPQIVPGFAPLFVKPGMDEADVDAALRRDARDFAWAHPAYVAEVLAWNLLRMFEVAGGSVVDLGGRPLDDRGIGSADPMAERVGLAIAAMLALLGAVALARSKPRSAGQPPRIPRGPLFLWAVPILMIVATAFLNGLPRDRLPADPFLLILAAIGLSWLWDRLRPQAAGAV
jgi:4-amino-4-deoxy-L-arabinose transferase-like glycosyltransferase